MKKQIISWGLATLIFLVTTPAHSAYIDVISQSCETAGTTLDYFDQQGSGVFYSWDMQSPTSVIAQAPGSGIISGSASLDVGTSTALLNSSVNILSFPSGQSSAELVFHPVDAPYLRLSVFDAFSSGEAWPKLTLEDNTTGDMLFSLYVACGVFRIEQAFPGPIQDGTYYGTPNLYSGLIPVDSSHIYSLQSSVLATDDRGNIWAGVALVPEPSSILLLGTGLFVMIAFGKKIKRVA